MLTRRVLLPLTALGLVLGAAAPAAAQTVTDAVVDEVVSDGVYVDPAFDVDVDEAALERAVDDASQPVYVVLLPQDVLTRDNAPQVAPALGEATGESRATVLLVSDEPYAYAVAGPQARARGVDAASALTQALEVTPDGTITGPVVTDLVTTFVDRVDAQLGAGGTGSGGAGSGSGGGSSALPVLLGLGALGGGAYALSRARRGRKQHATSMQDNRADVESLYARLGSDVQTLAPGDDAVARQALADAAERYNATGALMARASTDGEWAAARRTAVEGLTASRVVRQRLGLDPGPEIPVPAAEQAPRLDAPSRVRVGDEEHEGSPEYTPGRPHYFEGGYHGGALVPGGWYATPFWQTMLIGSVLGGGRRSRYGYGRGAGYGGGMLGGGMLGGGLFSGGMRSGGRRRSSGGWSGGGGGWGGGGRRGGGGW